MSVAELKHKNLKTNLKKLVQTITDQTVTDESTLEEAISTLQNLIAGKSDENGRRPPDHFLCPFSGEIMADPVVVDSGQTYDRPYIEKWLKSGNRTCPVTKQVLSTNLLTPNTLVRTMITNWCTQTGTINPTPTQCPPVMQSDQAHLDSLLDQLATSSTPRKHILKQLRQLTKHDSSYRALLGESPNAIPMLIRVLSDRDVDAEVREDAVVTLLNVSINESNKIIIGSNQDAIRTLVHSLSIGTMSSRGSAAAALFTLSVLEENKSRIAIMGAISPLLELISHDDVRARTDAAAALFSLCKSVETRGKVVKEGAVGVFMNGLVENIAGFADIALTMLALLASEEEAVAEMVAGDGVKIMFGILRGECGRKTKENAMVVLCEMVGNRPECVREAREEEERSGCLSRAAEDGTPRARRKVERILKLLKRDRMRERRH